MMNEVIALTTFNLEKVGIGVVLFLAVYLANMGLGAWKNVKVDGYDFDIRLIGKSLVKFLIMGVAISLLTIAVSVLPIYITYVGIQIDAEIINALDGIVIVGAFLSATIRYAKEAMDKLSKILSGK